MDLQPAFVIAFAVMVTGGLFALLASGRPKLSAGFGWTGLFTGLIVSAYAILLDVQPSAGEPNSTILFQLPILVLSGTGAIHSIGYLRGHGEDRTGLFCFLYNLTVCAMLSVTLLADPVAFLVAWEIMGLTSFALVCFEYRAAQTVRAAWIYLVACQAGSAFLILMILFHANPMTVFVLALLGFGLKIGFPLLHVWLPEAHPAAPAPVSALLSGAMIPLGFYGLLRFGTLDVGMYGIYGGVLLTLGACGALFGVLFALPQNNLKKLLAYSSIENMGILALGLGLGFLGAAGNNPAMYFCGFGGAFLHLLNHALLKGGLFLGAGSIWKASGSLELDRLGGMWHRMPQTGSFFLLNSVGICGLPPFHGFPGEFLIYLAAFFGLTGKFSGLICSGSALALIVLALSGGLAAAVFAKASGAVFLGEPRSPNASDALEQPATMRYPVMVLFFLGCVLTLIAPYVLGFLFPDVCLMFPEGQYWNPETDEMVNALSMVSFCSLAATGLFLCVVYFRFRCARSCGKTRVSGTWDCGYMAPTARMEYTGSAFVQPLTRLFGMLLLPERRLVKPNTEFPETASLEEEVRDPGLVRWWIPVFDAAGRAAEKIHRLQSGYLHFYVLVLVLALLVMLAWGLLLPWSGLLLQKGGL